MNSVSMRSVKAFDLEDIKETLKEDGFAVVSSLLSGSSELANLQNKIYDVVSIRGGKIGLTLEERSIDGLNKLTIALDKDSPTHSGFIYDVLNQSPELFSLLNNAFLLDHIKELVFNSNAVLCSNNNSLRFHVKGRDQRTNLPWHQDSHYNDLYITDNAIAGWISIFDITKEHGPVVFKKGSHALGTLPMQDAQYDSGRTLLGVPQSYVEDERYKECINETKAGDLVLINMDIIHRSGVNSLEDAVRWSCQARYHNCANPDFMPKYP